MTNIRWVACFLTLCGISLMAFAAIMYATDPLIQYGKENGLFSYYEYSEMYSNPGIAKNYDYDAVLVGTSMIQNTDVHECNELFDCNMVRLSYSGGTCHNMKKILDVCFASDNDIQTVFWELDEFQLFSDAYTTRYPLPEYLYRNDHRQDVSYLLNLDIFYHYNLKNLLGTLRGEEQMVARTGGMFGGDFSKQGMMKTYSRSEKVSEAKPLELYEEKVLANLNTNMIPLLEENTETEFVFFMVPFSVLYWDNEIQRGTFDATMYGLELAISQLLEYENATIYFYHDKWDVATDLDNYKDYSHYGKWINSEMSAWIAKDEGRLTKDNYKETLDSMKRFIVEYDFEGLFAE